MAITMTGTYTAPSIPATVSPSRTRLDGYAIQLNGLPASTPTTSYVLYTGSKAGGAPPVVFSDLVAPSRNPGSIADGYDKLMLMFDPSTVTYRMSLQTSGNDESGRAVGQQIWVCLFDIDPPLAATPVLAALSVGLMQA